MITRLIVEIKKEGCNKNKVEELQHEILLRREVEDVDIEYWCEECLSDLHLLTNGNFRCGNESCNMYGSEQRIDA